MDLRTAAEKLARGAYGFGVSGECAGAADELRADVQVIWDNAADNPPRSCIVRMLVDLEDEFEAAWELFVTRRADGWLGG